MLSDAQLIFELQNLHLGIYREKRLVEIIEDCLELRRAVRDMHKSQPLLDYLEQRAKVKEMVKET